MKTFQFVMYIKTKGGQEFEIGRCKIEAKNADDAIDLFNSKDLPFHHFSTIQKIK